MANRVYFMPTAIFSIGSPAKNQKMPKYAQSDMSGHAWGCMMYGAEDFCLVGTDDIPALVAETDVLSAPLNLDANLTAGAVTVVQNALEAQNVPAEWVNTGLTYRQVIRKISGFFSLLQRLSFYNTARLFSAATLALTFGSLSAAWQANILAAAVDLSLSTAGLTGSTTVRQMLNSVGDQLSGRVIYLGQFSV